MASTATVSKIEHDELCCSYAALICHDHGLEASADHITKLIAASGNQVESYWPGLFAKALSGVDLSGLLSSVGSAGGAAAPGATAVAAAQEAPKEEEKEPQEEEADVGVGDIFGGDDY